MVSAVRRGEVLTDVRLVGAGGARGLGPGLVAAPVRVADAETVALLRPGDVVDVLAAEPTDGAAREARLVAAAVRVARRARARPSTGFGAGLGDGGLVLLATTSTDGRAARRCRSHRPALGRRCAADDTAPRLCQGGDPHMPDGGRIR